MKTITIKEIKWIDVPVMRNGVNRPKEQKEFTSG